MSKSVKKTPQRMCVACRQMQDKRQLIRIVNYGGVVSVDLTGKAMGRGAYLCANEECVAKCKKSKALNRVFETEVADEVYQQIVEVINAKR